LLNSTIDHGIWGGVLVQNLHHAFPFNVAIPTAPMVQLSSDVTTVESGGTANLTWSVLNATSCTATASPASSAWTGMKSVNGGTQTTGALSADTTFTITCSDDALQADSATVIVFVDKTTPICSDRRDNDGDGWVDADDPGCYPNGVYDPYDNDEQNGVMTQACSDGIDNDTDGKIDAKDTGCGNWDDNDETDIIPASPASGGDTTNPGDVNVGDIDFKEF